MFQGNSTYFKDIVKSLLKNKKTNCVAMKLIDTCSINEK